MNYTTKYKSPTYLSHYPEKQKYLIGFNRFEKHLEKHCKAKSEAIRSIKNMKLWKINPDEIELICGETGEVLRIYHISEIDKFLKPAR